MNASYPNKDLEELESLFDSNSKKYVVSDQEIEELFTPFEKPSYDVKKDFDEMNDFIYHIANSNLLPFTDFTPYDSVPKGVKLFFEIEDKVIKRARKQQMNIMKVDFVPESVPYFFKMVDNVIYADPLKTLKELIQNYQEDIESFEETPKDQPDYLFISDDNFEFGKSLAESLNLKMSLKALLEDPLEDLDLISGNDFNEPLVYRMIASFKEAERFYKSRKFYENFREEYTKLVSDLQESMDKIPNLIDYLEERGLSDMLDDAVLLESAARSLNFEDFNSALINLENYAEKNVEKSQYILTMLENFKDFIDSYKRFVEFENKLDDFAKRHYLYLDGKDLKYLISHNKEEILGRLKSRINTLNSLEPVKNLQGANFYFIPYNLFTEDLEYLDVLGSVGYFEGNDLYRVGYIVSVKDAEPEMDLKSPLKSALKVGGLISAIGLASYFGDIGLGTAEAYYVLTPAGAGLGGVLSGLVGYYKAYRKSKKIHEEERKREEEKKERLKRKLKAISLV